jgi:hypothetical protein
MRVDSRRAGKITCHRIRNRASVSKVVQYVIGEEINNIKGSIEYEPASKLIVLSMADKDKRSYIR